VESDQRWLTQRAAERDKLAEQCQRGEQERIRLCDDLDQANKTLDELRAEVLKLESLTRDVASLKAENAELREDRKRVGANVDSLQQRVRREAESSEDSQRLRIEMEKHLAMVAEARNAHNAMTKTLESEQAGARGLRQHNLELLAELDHARSQASEARRELNTTRQLLQQLKKELDCTASDLEASRRQVSTLQNEVNSMAPTSANTEAGLESKQNLVDSLSSQLMKMGDELAFFREALRAAEASEEELRADLERSKVPVPKLRGDSLESFRDARPSSGQPHSGEAGSPSPEETTSGDGNLPPKAEPTTQGRAPLKSGKKAGDTLGGYRNSAELKSPTAGRSRPPSSPAYSSTAFVSRSPSASRADVALVAPENAGRVALTTMIGSPSGSPSRQRRSASPALSAGELHEQHLEQLTALEAKGLDGLVPISVLPRKGGKVSNVGHMLELLELIDQLRSPLKLIYRHYVARSAAKIAPNTAHQPGLGLYQLRVLAKDIQATPELLGQLVSLMAEAKTRPDPGTDGLSFKDFVRLLVLMCHNLIQRPCAAIGTKWELFTQTYLLPHAGRFTTDDFRAKLFLSSEVQTALCDASEVLMMLFEAFGTPSPSDSSGARQVSFRGFFDFLGTFPAPSSLAGT
jgi:uncharacterized coiled-coil DUF342 family protein